MIFEYLAFSFVNVFILLIGVGIGRSSVTSPKIAVVEYNKEQNGEAQEHL